MRPLHPPAAPCDAPPRQPPAPAPSRRAALAAAAAAAVTLTRPPPAPAAPAPFCGATDVVPSWAYMTPFSEAMVDGGGGVCPLWTRTVGKPPSRGLLGLSKAPAPPHPVLVIPGEPGLPCTYLESLELLGGNRCVGFYDPPFVGRSQPRPVPDAPPATAAATPADLVAAVSAAATGLWPAPDQKVHLVADGLGGLVALDALAADPALRSRVVSITLLATPPSPAAGVAGRVARAAAVLGKERAAAAQSGDESAVSAFVANTVVRRPAGCVADARARAEGQVAAALVGGDPLFQLGGSFASWTPRLPPANSLPPVLLIYGEDGSVPPSDAAALAAAIGGRVVTVPAAGDWVAVDAAADVVDAIEKAAEGAEGAGAD